MRLYYLTVNNLPVVYNCYLWIMTVTCGLWLLPVDYEILMQVSQTFQQLDTNTLDLNNRKSKLNKSNIYLLVSQTILIKFYSSKTPNVYL